MSTAIQVQNLSKAFEQLRPASTSRSWKSRLWKEKHWVDAVKQLDFQIAEGERIAFIGPNGAGKSTTIKMLTGILRPSSGAVEVLGKNPWENRQQLAYRIGSVFGQRSQLWYQLPAIQTFDLLRSIYSIDMSSFQHRRDRLIASFQLETIVHQPVRKLSLGQRMRCEIVASLLHQPAILFLDEPTIGLDVTAKASIREFIREQSKEEGTTLFLTSHDTGDIEKVCDRVLIVNEGALILDLSLDELRQRYIRHKLIRLKTAEKSCHFSIPGIEIVKQEAHLLELKVNLELTSMDQLLQHAMHNATIHDISIMDPPMEEIIRAIYQSEMSGA
ncbi:MAG: ABC transporter ATP-binding protein [Oligoflexus sp.]